MLRDSREDVVRLFLFSYYFFASQARARTGPGARGTPLCEAHGRAQFPLLPHESGAACGCSSSKSGGRNPTVFERNRVALSSLFALC